MISYDKLWGKLAEQHINKTEFKERTGMSNCTLMKMVRNEPVNLKFIESACKELNCGIGDLVEIR